VAEQTTSTNKIRRTAYKYKELHEVAMENKTNILKKYEDYRVEFVEVMSNKIYAINSALNQILAEELSSNPGFKQRTTDYYGIIYYIDRKNKEFPVQYQTKKGENRNALRPIEEMPVPYIAGEGYRINKILSKHHRFSLIPNKYVAIVEEIYNLLISYNQAEEKKTRNTNHVFSKDILLRKPYITPQGYVSLKKAGLDNSESDPKYVEEIKGLRINLSRPVIRPIHNASFLISYSESKNNLVVSPHTSDYLLFADKKMLNLLRKGLKVTEKLIEKKRRTASKIYKRAIRIIKKAKYDKHLITRKI